MLNPPKIHFVGNTQACAKWLPFAQKKMQYLMTAFQGAHFHKKFRVPGATIWLDNDGYIRRILIQAEMAYYEFATAFDFRRASPSSRMIFADVKFTRVMKNLRSKNINGRNFTETNDDFALDIYSVSRDGWFSDSGTKMTTCKTTEGRYQDDFYRINIHSVYGPDQYPMPIYGNGEGWKKKAGGKLKPLSAEITSGDSVSVSEGNKGSTACLSGEFEILASAVGYDHLFAVHHPGSNQTIEVTPDEGVPGWIAGRVRSCWQFAPDGKRAVSLQYWSDVEDKINLADRVLSAPPYWKTGVSEVVFDPYLDTDGNLQCDCRLGVQITGKSDLFLLAVDYDLKDSDTMRVVRARVYHDSPDPDNNMAVCVLIIGEWSLINTDNSEIAAPYRRAILSHLPAIWDVSTASSHDGANILIEYKMPGSNKEYFAPRYANNIAPILLESEFVDDTAKSFNPLWDRHGYGVIETQLDVDLRRDAWSMQQHMPVQKSDAFSENPILSADYPRSAYRYEWGIDGRLRDSYWERGFVNDGAMTAINKDWSAVYPGYVEFTEDSTYWEDGWLYNYYHLLSEDQPELGNVKIVRNTFSLFYLISRLKPGDRRITDISVIRDRDRAFRLHPDGHFALFHPPLGFDSDSYYYLFNAIRYVGRGDIPPTGYLNRYYAAPPEMIIDHIEVGYGERDEDGVPGPSTKHTTHLSRFNDDRIPPGQFDLNHKHVICLAPYGVWLI